MLRIIEGFVVFIIFAFLIVSVIGVFFYPTFVMHGLLLIGYICLFHAIGTAILTMVGEFKSLDLVVFFIPIVGFVCLAYALGIYLIFK